MGEFCLYFNEDANGGYYIESYRWVTRSECLKAGPLPLFD
jgi:hypothetical protein